MAVGEWFATFCSNLIVPDQDSISLRYKRITRRVNTDFWNTDSETAHSFYAGSYGRDTAIKGFSDLDMVFELPSSVYAQYDSYLGNGQSALLQAVRASVTKTYTNTSIRADGQIIQIPFTDGITFELLPSFKNTDGSYTYPDSNGGGSWKICDPKAEIRAMDSRNKDCNYNLTRLCRMMRKWKNHNNVPIKGLLIDTLAYQFIENWSYRDKSFLYYDWLSRDFFLWMSNQDKEQTWWRAPGSGRYVYGKGLFQYKAKQAYNLAAEAIAHQSKDEDWSAKYDWRQIYGTAFPD